MHLVFDTETTGFVNSKLPPIHPSQPHLVQLGAILIDDSQQSVAELGCLLRPEGWTIPEGAAKVHGITTERATKHGLSAALVLELFSDLCARADTLVCHNISFDLAVMETFAARQNAKSPLFLARHRQICTMLNSTDLCKLPGRYPGSYKWPRLQELHKFLFKEEFEDAHSALADVRATQRCYLQMLRCGHITLSAAPPPKIPTSNLMAELVPVN